MMRALAGDDTRISFDGRLSNQIAQNFRPAYFHSEGLQFLNWRYIPIALTESSRCCPNPCAAGAELFNKVAGAAKQLCEQLHRVRIPRHHLAAFHAQVAQQSRSCRAVTEDRVFHDGLPRTYRGEEVPEMVVAVTVFLGRVILLERDRRGAFFTRARVLLVIRL